MSDKKEIVKDDELDELLDSKTKIIMIFVVT